MRDPQVLLVPANCEQGESLGQVWVLCSKREFGTSHQI